MDAETNTALVKQAWERISRHDVPAFLDLLTENIVWDVPAMPDVPFAGTWRGRDGVARFFRTVADSQEVIEFVPDEFIAQRDKVIVLGRFANRVKATGRTASSAWAQVWTVRDGKISHMREYVDTQAVSSAYGSLSSEQRDPNRSTSVVRS